jgi:tellurite methyltransferase
MTPDPSIWEVYWQGNRNHPWWKRPAPEVEEFIASQSPAERKDVLDLGCGLGRHTVAFARAGFSVTAADASEEAISHLSRWAEELSLKVRVLVCDVMSDKLPENSFDIVLAYNVIYHGHRQEFRGAIDRVYRLLRPGGLFCFTCPTREDGKYGFGREVAPHTFLCEKSITPGDIHYFSDEADLDQLLSDFSVVDRAKREGYWENKGERQFYSNWHLLVGKHIEPIEKK